MEILQRKKKSPSMLIIFLKTPYRYFIFCIFFFRALDKNEYNHITATYFLLAERKLRAHRQEQAQRKRPEQLSVTSHKVMANRSNDIPNNNNNSMGLNPTMLTVPRTPGDVPQVGYFYKISNNKLKL